MAEDVQLDLIFGALAHPKRRGMIHDLALHPATITQLARDYDLSLPAIHKHMDVLETAGLIIRKKSGRTNFIVLKNGSLAPAKAWLEPYRTQWGSDVATLDNYITRMQE